MSGPWTDLARAANASTRAEGRWRSVRTLDSGTPDTATADGTAVVSFASNDYLGLTQHPAVVAAAHAALDRYGTGAGAARLIVGGRPVHDELEAALAAWKGADAALLLPTGFAANLAAIGALVHLAGRRDTLIVSDELNHASIIDGVRLAGAETAISRHCDVDHVADLLRNRRAPHAIVVTDSVFSMDGDVAPVEDLAALCAETGALLVLDEAHAVLGPAGPSGCEVVTVGTLSKTLGSQGGFVAGSRPIIDAVLNRGRAFIFTTALAPAAAAAALAAVDLVRGPRGAEVTGRLRRVVARVAPGHPSPIVPVLLGDEQRAVSVSTALLERGVLVPAIRPPTVAPGTCRLRIALSAAHTDDHLSMLLTTLDELGVDLFAGRGPQRAGAV